MVDKLSIGEINSGPFNAIDSLVDRINDEDFAGITQMPYQAPAAAADVAALKTQFDALLTKLVNAGLMASS